MTIANLRRLMAEADEQARLHPYSEEDEGYAMPRFRANARLYEATMAALPALLEAAELLREARRIVSAAADSYGGYGYGHEQAAALGKDIDATLAKLGEK